MFDAEAALALCTPQSPVTVLVGCRPVPTEHEPQVTHKTPHLTEETEIEFRNGLTFYMFLFFLLRSSVFITPFQNSCYEDSQCAYNVTLRCVRVTTTAVEKQ
jgi:hypothetical protein